MFEVDWINIVYIYIAQKKTQGVPMCLIILPIQTATLGILHFQTHLVAEQNPIQVQLVSHFDIRPTIKTWIDDHPPILSTRIRLLTMAIMASGLLGHPNISSQRSWSHSSANRKTGQINDSPVPGRFPQSDWRTSSLWTAEPGWNTRNRILGPRLLIFVSQDSQDMQRMAISGQYTR